MPIPSRDRPLHSTSRHAACFAIRAVRRCVIIRTPVESPGFRRHARQVTQQHEQIMEQILGRIAVRIPTWSRSNVGAQHVIRRFKKVVACRLQPVSVLVHRVRIAAGIVKKARAHRGARRFPPVRNRPFPAPDVGAATAGQVGTQHPRTMISSAEGFQRGVLAAHRRFAQRDHQLSSDGLSPARSACIVSQ